jgi:hypothetical protein
VEGKKYLRLCHAQSRGLEALNVRVTGAEELALKTRGNVFRGEQKDWDGRKKLAGIPVTREDTAHGQGAIERLCEEYRRYRGKDALVKKSCV